MLVKDIMNTDVKTADEDTTIQEAAKIMNKFSIGSLIIVKNQKLVGILTERDILSKVVATAEDPSQFKIKDAMTKEVILVKPDMDAQEAVELMHKHKIKKLPVVSGHNLVGIVTAYDLCMIEPKFVEKLSALFVFPKEGKSYAG